VLYKTSGYSFEYNNRYFFIKINYFPFKEQDSIKGYLCIKTLRQQSYFIENKEELFNYIKVLEKFSKSFDNESKKDLEEIIRKLKSLLHFEKELKKLDTLLKKKFDF